VGRGSVKVTSALVTLVDGRIESRPQLRNARFVERAGRHDDVVGLELRRAALRLDPEARITAVQGTHAHPPSHRQVKVRDVALEICRHLVLVREVIRRRRKGHARQPAVARGREEAQRIPSAAPVVTDPFLITEDHEVHVAGREVVADG